MGRSAQVNHSVKIGPSPTAHERWPRLAEFCEAVRAGDRITVIGTNESAFSRYVNIENQELQHQRISFQNELRTLFVKHEMEFDERYVWD